MNAAYAGHIERGVQNPTLNTLERICKGLDISVEVIDRLARAFYPAILACWNSEEGHRSLVGARPLHLAAQDRSVA